LPNDIQQVTLSASQLTRRFGGKAVVHDLSITLKHGEILGLLGHNGAGKSTSMQMLSGCLLPDHGEISICGVDLLRQPTLAKKYIGYLPETPPLYRELSVNDYLTFVARLHGIKVNATATALDQAKQRCGLDTVGKKIIGTLSKGYQQRVGIAQAIIHSPNVIILDEPTVGLDPAQIREIRTLIRELGDSSSVILSTHLLSEVQSICNRVKIMRQGKVIYSDTSENMQQYGSVSGFTISLGNPPLLQELQAIEGITDIEQISTSQFRIMHTSDHNPSDTLIGLSGERNWQLEQLTPLQATLEEVYVKITASENASDGETK